MSKIIITTDIAFTGCHINRPTKQQHFPSDFSHFKVISKLIEIMKFLDNTTKICFKNLQSKLWLYFMLCPCTPLAFLGKGK